MTDGIEAALERAYDAADGQDLRLAGGVSTIQQYLRAGLVDEMHLAYAPLLLGSGERLFDDLAERTGRVRDCRVRRYAGRAACPLPGRLRSWHSGVKKRGDDRHQELAAVHQRHV